VLANATGGSMERVSAFNTIGSASNGAFSSPQRATGFITNRGYGTGATNVAIVNITGKGALRFLSAGPYLNTAGFVTLIIDGITILNDAGVYWNNSYEPGYSYCFVGSVVSSYDGSNAQWDMSAVPSDYGITFKTSLQIYVRGGSAGQTTYCNYSYVLY
jgi:hypothetical protein